MTRFNGMSDEEVVEEALGMTGQSNAARAEMSRRLIRALRESSAQATRHAESLNKLTVVLIVLTLVIMALTAAMVLEAFGTF